MHCQTKKQIQIIMKRINYCRLFTQEMRKNGVLGIFCEKASEELLSLLYSNKDTWDKVTNERTTCDRAREISNELEKEGEMRVFEALKVTNTIWETIEIKF